MNAKIHEVVEGIQYQGVDEEITYDIDTANWDVANNYADVTATVMPAGSPSVSSDTITLPELKSLTMDKHYRIEVKFTISGNIMECYVPVIGTR
jgi:hypothetical protein